MIGEDPLLSAAERTYYDRALETLQSDVFVGRLDDNHSELSTETRSRPRIGGRMSGVWASTTSSGSPCRRSTTAGAAAS